MERTASFGIGTSPSNSSIEPQSFVCREVLVVITTIALSIITAIIAFSILPAELALVVTIIATIGEYMMINGCCVVTDTAIKIQGVVNSSRTSPFEDPDYTKYYTSRGSYTYRHEAPSPPGRRRVLIPRPNLFDESYPPTASITSRARCSGPAAFPRSPLASGPRSATAKTGELPRFPGNPSRAQNVAVRSEGLPAFPGNPPRAQNVAVRNEGLPTFPGNPSRAQNVAGGSEGLPAFPGNPTDRR